MTLYTIQHPDVLNEINQFGEYQASGKFIYDEHFRDAYEWYVAEAKKRISNWKAEHAVWVWTERPDLRKSRFFKDASLPKFMPQILIELEVPEDQVLLSDFQLWHCVLNNNFIAYNDKESNDLEKDPLSQIKSTWHRCLYIGPDSFQKFDPEYQSNPLILQGIIEGIKKDQIKSIKNFITTNKA